MKIEPIEIEQTDYATIFVDVSKINFVRMWNGIHAVIIEREKIQELIDILEHEKL